MGNLRILACVFLALVLGLIPYTYADEFQESFIPELLDKLTAGGYNIYFRHAETDWSQADTIEKAGDWTSCNPARIRQLSDQGRRNSARVGEAIRALDLPIGKVVASPYCRTVETAELMNIGSVDTTNDIINLRVAEFFGGRDQVIKTAQSLLAIEPIDGANVVLVGHGNVARGATEVYPEEAEGLIFRPDGAGGFELVTRLTSQQWERFAAWVQQHRTNQNSAK